MKKYGSIDFRSKSIAKMQGHFPGETPHRKVSNPEGGDINGQPLPIPVNYPTHPGEKEYVEKLNRNSNKQSTVL